MNKAKLATALLLLCGSMAAASSVTARHVGTIDQSLAFVRVDGGLYSVYVGKSVFEVDSVDTDDGLMVGQANGLVGGFEGYCIEFSQLVEDDVTVTWDLNLLPDAPAPAMGLLRAAMVSQLLGIEGAVAGFSHQAEMQLAIWEIVEEDFQSGLDISTGQFDAVIEGYYSNYDVGMVQGWLNQLDLDTMLSLGEQELLLLVADKFALTHESVQDFVVTPPSSPPPPPVVPEPMTLLGGLMGCGAVARYIRRRRR